MATFTQWRSLVDGSKINAIPDSGVARWDHENAINDTSILEDVWHDNDGTVNGPTYNSTGGPDGNGEYQYDASGNYIQLPSGASVGGLSEFTIAIQASPSKVNKYHALYAESDATNSEGGLKLQFTDDAHSPSNAYKIYFTNDSGTAFDTSTSNWTADSYQWFIYRSTGSAIEAWVDDTQEASTSVSGSLNTSLNDIRMGMDGSVGGEYLDGDTADGRAYDKALSPTEISNLVSTGSISG